MASIDQYKHRLLGFINCPSDYEIVDNNPTRDIAVYELLEDIPKDETDFDGKIGDIIVGGGSGEVSAFRISIPGALDFFVYERDVDFDDYEDDLKPFGDLLSLSNFVMVSERLGGTQDGRSSFGWQRTSA
jgi:hypothetical protein